MRNDESRTSTNTTRFVGRRGMVLAANNPTVMPQICDPSFTEGTRSALATGSGQERGHQKKSVRISSHSPIFIRASSPDVMRSRHSFPYPSSSSKHQGRATAVNPAGHHSSPAAVECDRTYTYSTTMTRSSRSSRSSSRSNRNR